MGIDSRGRQAVAIVALTRKGVELGRRLRPLLAGSELYLPERFRVGDELGEHPFSSPAGELVRELFHRYRHLVLIMAVGLAVRLVASEIRNKHQDPGVVVVDDGGTFSVSLLSGHAGGANELSRKIASLLGACAVVTTASDVNKTICVDLLGKEFGWELEDGPNVAGVSACLLNGESVGVHQDAGERSWWPEGRPLPENVRVFGGLDDLIRADCAAAIIISDRALEGKLCALLPRRSVVWRPKSLVVGVGCNRGTSGAEIEAAVAGVFCRHGLSLRSMRNVATVDLKKDEVGILRFAQDHGVPVEYFAGEELSKADFLSPASDAALRHAGTPAVCESAAMLSSAGLLLVRKESFGRAVTVAVARVAFKHESRKKGKLFLVGLGPGGLEHMTLRARDVLGACEVVVGYKSYIKLIEPLLLQKEIVATGMGREIERARKAISLAREGSRVALVSGGDVGIYGMAGLVGEMLCEDGGALAVEVVPGVPAMASAASLLGAPIMGDLAVVSLSDYLVSWGEISLRLKLAAQGDFVIVLYNPGSKSRRHQLVEARRIVLQYRSPSTPVGLVTDAYREGQRVVISNLEGMLEHEVGMNTTIIIGSSTAFSFDGWIVTPRGYSRKYSLTGQELNEERPGSQGI